MKEQYPIEFNDLASDFLNRAMNDFDHTYPTPTMSEREVGALPPVYFSAPWHLTCESVSSRIELCSPS